MSYELTMSAHTHKHNREKKNNNKSSSFEGVYVNVCHFYHPPTLHKMIK